MIKAVIVDDEPLCAAALVEDVKKFAGRVAIDKVFHNGYEALQYLRENQPDLVFLDIEMPGMSGIELLNQLGHFSFKVVFTTAFDQFAIRAIRLNALDYLLKPIHFDELTVAIERAEEALKKRTAEEGKIILTDKNSMEIVSVENIVYCESERNYTTFYFQDGRNKLLSKNIGLFEKLLNPDMFFRIHQSYLVNLGYVTAVKKGIQFKISTSMGTDLPVARLKRTQFLEALEKFGKYSSV